MDLSPQQISLDVFHERYALPGEQTLAAQRARVAAALAQREPARERWRERFFWALQNGLIPGGRINCAAGSGLDATLLNCFVQPLGDSIGEIYGGLHQAAETMRRGGGVGYNFSALRPAGAAVASTGSQASGPVSFMRLFDCSGQVIESAGARRGAQMAVLDCDHPDIEAFIHAKDDGALSHFNLSVGASDAFLQAVVEDAPWRLCHVAAPAAQAYPEARPLPDGRWCYRELPARQLWAQIMASAYDHAEPGILFLDQINRDNNLGYCERIAATNPCGEQPLPAHASCDLASVNLAALVQAPFSAQARLDWHKLARLARIGVRLLDNVYDLTCWPWPAQQQEALQKRRLGLGFLGLGDALLMLGLHYGHPAARVLAQRVAETLRNAAYLASVALARERGPFPLFDAEALLAAPHSASRLPAAIQRQIRRYGLRNSHLTCLAPTGTISLAFADNASNGIEPVYAWEVQRVKRLPQGGTRTYRVQDHAWRVYLAQGGGGAVTAAAVRYRAGLAGAGADADGGGGAALYRRRDFQDGEYPVRLSLFRF